ncbi:MAG: Preprotein translocase, SecG subunit [Pedosphaera sp.]|nr:Preprotein translocase, SecG subunit [Pedosphaera sp.]
MIYWLSILLSIVLVVDCLFLILLVLVQLPKKEAGAGIAFGGGTADALFGAGSGTALTQLTKYAAGVFFVLAFTLSIMNTRVRNRTAAEFQRQFEQNKVPATAPLTTPSAPAPKTSVTNAEAIPLTIPTTTNVAPVVPGTNPPAK